MERIQAVKLTKELLTKHNLTDWSVKLSLNGDSKFLGMCDHKSRSILLNAIAVDIHPDEGVIDTIRHEVAHALVGPNHGHDLVWMAKAEELGARPDACSTMSLPKHVVDAIRSGQIVEMEMETIQIPKYKVTRLQDKCPDCGKVAKEKYSFDTTDKEGNQVKSIVLECFHIIKKIIPKATPFEKMVSNDWDDRVKSCFHKWPTKDESKSKGIPPNKCLNCGEYKLYPFQVVGARSTEIGLAEQKGFGIFDDMGLGKTVQVLAVIKYHPEYTPTLYVVKSALKFQFFKNIIRWNGPDYLPQIIATSRDHVFPNLKSYIISYDLLRRFPREKIEALGIKLVVLDECQQIKNPDSARTKEVRRIVGNPEVKVIPLSGTPWKNRGSEYFPVLNMMSPTKFYSQQAFLDRWVEFYWDGAKKKMGGIRNIKKFREYTEGLLIRREYNEVMDEFPDINRMKLSVQLDELSQDTYDDAVSDFVEWYNQALIDGMEESLSGIELLGRMARMRHITGLAKIPATVGFVEEFIEDTDRKLVIFVHHKDVGELLYNELVKIAGDIPVMKLTAGDDGVKFTVQEEFNKTPRAFLVASTLASGEGIDLQTCADCVMHERQWNPQNEDQAAPGRFRRIGQESSVINITFTEADGTIDEDLNNIVESKRIAFHQSMNKSSMPVWDEGDFAKELAAKIISKHKTRKQKVGV